jgi:serine/threonine protein kinase
MNDDPRILNLILRWQELHRQGHNLPLAELCIDCPELVEAVARQLEVLAPAEDFPTTIDPPVVTPFHPPAPTTALAPTSTLPEYAGRFHVLGEIARGGMGKVLRAHDPAIGRDVATKVIRPEYSQDRDLVRRFFGEARLTGQLQHPGVAPVYDLGQLPDGRPFFAMKLIEGRTLAELLRDPRDPERDLSRFLGYFEAVCQTIGCAHSRGIIHRDLKPLNIMVGAFGEVQLMDWGLAKVLGDAEGEGGPLRLEQPGRGAGESAAAVVGTPGYMAPEQARCETALIDARSDVFGLGAILCEILTGGPPFRGKGLVDVLARTARGEVGDAFARLDGCRADAELVRLAKACLAPKRAERPADGNAVAGQVRRIQERFQQAELARVRAEEERQRRRLEAAQAHYNRGGTLYRQGRFKEAETAYRQALSLNAEFPMALHNLGMTLAARGRFQEAEEAYRASLRLKPDYPMAHLNLGSALGSLGRQEEAEAAYREALRLDPHNPAAHCNLAAALQEQGRLTESLEAFRHGHLLGTQLPGWRSPSEQWVREAERLVELDHRLPAILRGDAAPASAAEALEMASLCQHPAKRFHAAAVRLAAAAFAAEPKLADDLDAQPRYNAACSAVLAAAREAADARALSDTAAAELRSQALQWLRADLALYARMTVGDPQALQTARLQLAHWHSDGDLAPVRDKDALARLPEAERDAWGQLWASVDALRQRLSGLGNDQ